MKLNFKLERACSSLKIRKENLVLLCQLSYNFFVNVCFFSTLLAYKKLDKESMLFNGV